MRRIFCRERPHWRALADEYGFKFHTMYGQTYWDESAYYRFSLKQIENDLEDPTGEIYAMCMEVAERVTSDDELMSRFQIPRDHWDLVRNSWKAREPDLYARLDLVYDGRGPAKLLENNADTPTSLYESGFWQWLWLEDKLASGEFNARVDQFNSIQEKLIDRLACIRTEGPDDEVLHFACCKDTEEDRGTVQYLEDCALQAGIPCRFVYVEDIGRGGDGYFTDLDDQIITRIFKLYPWEFMLREEFGKLLAQFKTNFLEPPWKAVLSNKALLPMLWKIFPGHPNLLPAYFEDELAGSGLREYVKKPIFAREGCNISIIRNGTVIADVDGPYGAEGFIYQAYQPLPVFDRNHTLIGSWLIGEQPAGISIREDSSPVTHDLSRFLPHIID
ncbi:MAG: glutathionylspermidine synthase family protein [Desulfobulbaceae bacterium]|nr:glutathionylspermidine synthase family protein [Desulfobulbaceae bacterium]